MDTPVSSLDDTSGRPLPLHYLTFHDQSSKCVAWQDDECSALIEFVLLNSVDGKQWPIHKNMSFWNNAAKFVKQEAKTTHLRSGELSCL